MAQVKFKYSLIKDAKNWITRLFGSGITFTSSEWLLSKYPPKLLSDIKSAGNRKDALSVAIKYLKEDAGNIEKQRIIKEEIKVIKKAWKMREEAFFNSMIKIMPGTLSSDIFIGYFTTFFVCPYSEKENWFMVDFWSGVPHQITIIGHELLHLHFLHNYRQKLEGEGLSEKQIQILKESLTFLLNEKEFYNIIIKPDFGYKEHFELRQKLKKLWDESANFDSFLESAINEMKKGQ